MPDAPDHDSQWSAVGDGAGTRDRTCYDDFHGGRNHNVGVEPRHVSEREVPIG